MSSKRKQYVRLTVESVPVAKKYLLEGHDFTAVAKKLNVHPSTFKTFMTKYNLYRYCTNKANVTKIQNGTIPIPKHVDKPEILNTANTSMENKLKMIANSNDNKNHHIRSTTKVAHKAHNNKMQNIGSLSDLDKITLDYITKNISKISLDAKLEKLSDIIIDKLTDVFTDDELTNEDNIKSIKSKLLEIIDIVHDLAK